MPERFRPVHTSLALSAAARIVDEALATRLKEGLQPMAVAVIGGLITSTLLTLIVVPVVYTFLDDLTHPGRWRIVQAWRRRRS